jgi:hypothetical protein
VPTRIEFLKQAGFSDGEIGDWATTERRRMQEAGFTDNEIDEEFGVTRPPKEVPAAFIERLKQGNALHRILGTAGEYAQDYFGDEPLGFSPENTEALRKLGVVGDIIVPAAKPVDALLRSVPAGIAGLGAALGQAVEEGQDATLGPGQAPKGAAARDFAQLAQIAALLWGASRPKTGATRVPAANDTPASALPRAEDFRNAAAAISGTPASFRTEQKLLRLWSDHGIHPAEVAEDALRDPSIGEAIRSDSEKLPDAYVGANRTTTATSARPNVPAQLAESAEADSATVPAESKAAPVEADDRSSAKPNTSEVARMIAEAKRAPLKPPPPKPQRPFDADYPQEPATDAQGQLLADIEGRFLSAKFVAGRQFSGEADVPLSLEDIKGAMAEAGVGLKHVKDERPDVARTYSKALRGQYQGIDYNKGRPDTTIYLNVGPKARDRDLVIAHEFGHAIDHLAGNLSATLTHDEMAELSFVYGHLRHGRTESGHLLQPENFGYSGNDAIYAELVAEGLRAYMTDPNYFKTAAPKTAAKIRKAVAESPYLRRAIQFNSLGAIGIVGAGVRSQDRDDQ